MGWAGCEAREGRSVRIRIERALIAIGVALLVAWGAALAHRTLLGALAERAYRERLAAAHSASSLAPSIDRPRADEPAIVLPRAPDTREWDVARVAAYVESLATERDVEPLGLLEIPRLDVSVLVLDGIDEWALNRGVGRIPGTARFEEGGNVGIAGHRDGFFRALRGIAPGDLIEWRTPEGVRRYEVVWTEVVAPEAVEVLAPTDHAALTLVTCHPFYYAGPAPERFVVRARAIGEPAGQPPAAVASN
jgi:sortase A